jgi:hypothetical protein
VEGAGPKHTKGQKGVQRPVLPPGTLAPIHPGTSQPHERRPAQPGGIWPQRLGAGCHAD